MTHVKICGLMEEQHVKAASSADAIGFVFAPSRRRVSIERAQELSRLATNEVQRIGVFVNASYEEIDKAVKTVPLTMVQLHGDEPDELIQRIEVPVIQAFSIRTPDDVEKLDKIDSHMPFSH